MIEPLIPQGEASTPELSFSEKMMQKAINVYAKILGNKPFEELPIQAHDDQIVTLVQESYEAPENRKKIVGDRKLDDDFNELRHCVYIHYQEPRVMICYRGTDFKNVQDLISDIQIVLWINAMDSRVIESLNLYDAVNMKYPTHGKWISGHSLWGTISYIVAKHREFERCVVFNPWAAPTKSFFGMIQDTVFRKEWTKKITTYRILGDSISTLSFVGNIKMFILKSVAPLKLHSIDSFPQFFEKHPEE